MNFNPLMLLPLIMGGKNGGDADMTKMLEMMNVLKDGNPDALLSALPVDDKTKNRAEYGERIKSRKSKRGDRRKRRLCRPARKKPRPDARIFGADINRALSELMNGADGRR
ncbi:MAG: hypothetical protein L6V85_06335 [Clostridiales bacterium]|nr:MAG: hypothetical protein L6V85_06335 [Clostridiales bacterium]